MAECNIPKEPNAVEAAIAQTMHDIEKAGVFIDATSRLAALLPLQSHLRDLLEIRAELLRNPRFVVSGDTTPTGDRHG
jgi:hypothetical protein